MFEAFNTPEPDEEELEDTWGRDILRELAEAGLKPAWSRWSQERWAQNLDLSAQTAQPADG